MHRTYAVIRINFFKHPFVLSLQIAYLFIGQFKYLITLRRNTSY